MKSLGLNSVDVRDNRYDQVVHLITAADGAEEFYNCEDNPYRTEDPELARERDRATAQAWVGHPYIDVIDNSTNFEAKLTRMLAVSVIYFNSLSYYKTAGKEFIHHLFDS